MLRTSYNNILYILLCMYAFLIPFEHILEIFFRIDTVFKPYRIVAIMLIGIYAIRSLHLRKVTLNKDISHDIFLYLIFGYGLIISAIQVFFAPFLLQHFYNDSFQIVLYVSVFFILKNINLSFSQLRRIIWFFIAGIFINALYLFNNFYILQNFRRQSGFMDNPNYVSISLVVAISFLIIQVSYFRKWLPKIILFVSIFFLLLMLIFSGSRTGFIIFGFVTLLLLYFASWGKRLMIFSGIFFLFILYSSRQGAITLGAPLVLFERINKIDSSEDTRFPLWKGAYKAVLSSNFAGLGIGQFKTRFREFYQTEYEKTIYENVNRGAHLSPHNDYVAIAVTYGIFGLFCYLIFLFLSLKKVVQELRSKTIQQINLHYQFCFLVLISLALFGISAENFTSAVYWMSLGIATKVI